VDAAEGMGEGLVSIAATGVWLGWGRCAWPPQPATRIAAMRIAAGRWALEVRPERGGRIVSLRLDGEELLDQGIGIDQPTANGFVDGGAFGWDEMVPNLEPTDTLPDHGEAWRLPWEVLGGHVMRCRGQIVPWELEREIELADSVLVRYRYTNLGDEPHGAYWCAHPLFRYDPAMDVSVPIPRPAEGRSVKAFMPAASLDRVRLGRVEQCWDPRLTADVGVWVCNGDIGGYRQIAFEPATASPLLEPGASIAWWLQIRPLD
jgi:hypothetical protein